MEILGKLIITALAVIISTYLLPGVHIDGPITAVIIALVLSLMNAIVKPILIILTIPFTIFTLGLFLLVINAVIILLTDAVIPGFKVDGFWYALIFSLVVSLISWIFTNIGEKKRSQ